MVDAFEVWSAIPFQSRLYIFNPNPDDNIDKYAWDR